MGITKIGLVKCCHMFSSSSSMNLSPLNILCCYDGAAREAIDNKVHPLVGYIGEMKYYFVSAKNYSIAEIVACKVKFLIKSRLGIY